MTDLVCRHGMQIPRVGLGTWRLTDRGLIKNIVEEAYHCGYRLIDTAAAYSNEIALGIALRNLSVPRESVIISDKVWNTDRGHDAVIKACKTSLRKLKLDYMDLYLVHWPASPKLYPDWKEINADTWRGMEDLYRDGLVRAIGVCNFKPHHLEALFETAAVAPMVDQIELHPGFCQKDTMDYCREHGIVIEASSPLGNGNMLSDISLLDNIAVCHNKTVAQVCLRWAVQKGAVVLPKTATVSRLAENIALSDFKLTDDEMREVDGLPWCGSISGDPDEITKFG